MRSGQVFGLGGTVVLLAIVAGVTLEAKEKVGRAPVGTKAGKSSASKQDAKRSRVDCLIDQLLPALIHQESGGDDWAMGDKKLKHKAYGPLQVRQPYLDDVNQLWGTKHRAQSLRGNRRLSEKVTRAYLKLYATKSRLGREPRLEDLARIHNGGPNGWKIMATKCYWQDVKKILARQAKKRK